MLKEYPKFKRGEVETIYKKLPKVEQKFIEDYLFYRKSRGLSDRSADDLRRYVIQIRKIVDCPFKDFKTLNELTRLSVLISNSHLSNEVKKNLRINLSNLFKYLFPDWSSRFMGLDCFANKQQKGQDSEQGKISDSDLPSDEETEKMLKSEPSTFYKTFLLVMNSTGLRTIEARLIENNKITFNGDETATIEIYMTKTAKKKFIFTDKQTTNFIKKLQDENKNLNRFGKFLFPSHADFNVAVHKNTINKWFKNLSLKATGRQIKPYWYRHKKATSLYNLALNNIISKDVAIKLLGHSKDMAEHYTHRPDNETIAILKEQAFNTEISEPDKNRIVELEKQVFNLTIKVDDLLNGGYENEMKKIYMEFDKQKKEYT